MIRNSGIGSRIFDVFNFTFLTLITITFVYPFLYLFSISVSDPYEVAKFNIYFLPSGFTLEAYRSIFSTGDIITAYWNSIRYTAVGTVFSVTVACLTAYPLSLARFKYKKFFTLVFTVTMFISGGMIPTFILYKNIGILDTLWAVTLPAAFAFWNIVIMRTNFQSLPSELYESAFIDGANEWRILFGIVLPLSKAIIATVALFASVSLWNSFFPPLMYLNSAKMQPLTIILRRMLVANEIFAEADVKGSMVDPVLYTGKSISLKMATVFVTIGPIILVYPFVQKYFVQGVLVGSVKG